MQKKKNKRISGTVAQDEIVFRQMSDKKISEIATRLRRADEYNVLCQPFDENQKIKLINEVNFKQLINDMQTKLVPDLKTFCKQWFRCQDIDFDRDLPKPTFDFSYLEATKLKDIAEFEKRTWNNFYWNVDKIRKDLQNLFAWNYIYRVVDQCGYIYLARLWEQIDPFIIKFTQRLQEDKEVDMKNLIEMKQDYRVEVEKWPFVPTELRKYEVIEEYAPNPSEEPYAGIIWEKLKTQKQPYKCNAQCVCFQPQNFGSFSLEHQTWASRCPNRANRIECIEHEGTNEPCFNQSITLKKYKEVGKDVEETFCWGIDVYTRNIIYFCLPSFYSEEQKQNFISLSLMKSLNVQKEKGWDIKSGCEYILDNTQRKQERIKNPQQNKMFDPQDRRFAKSVLAAMPYDKGSLGFRAHTKGLGIVCKNKDGIRQNELLIQYLGEIYQPWRWFEKQDFIKKRMKDNNQKDILPDFYNITLEFHKDDPKGLDLLFVDPIIKGNYSSRLSHSCEPNCGTITTIANGRYTIGMYALKDIAYGEELTFDYCSTTESKQEYKQALCLCGQARCRIHYLDLNLSKESSLIIEREHCFLKRNACLLKACVNNEQPVARTLLEFYNVKSSVLDGCPNWLIQWAINILQFVEVEERLYIDEQSNEGIHRSLEIIKFLAAQFVESRVQNLIITMDKIKYYLQNCNDKTPPLSVVSNEQFVKEIWNQWDPKLPVQKREDSLIIELDYLISKKVERRSQALDLQSIPELKFARDLLVKVHEMLPNYDYDQQAQITRLMFLCLSHILLQVDKETQIHLEAMAIILYFMAFTYTYFKPYEYAGFSSIQFELHEIEWGKTGEKVKKSKNKPEKRTYSSQFIWGQLVGWFKQTVANPQASLSQDRRGTLSYPSFISSFDTPTKTYPFSETKSDLSPRTYFLKHVMEKPSYMWPPEAASWSYKNSYKLYGTVFFESVFSKDKVGDTFLQEVITNLENDIDAKINLFCMMENRMFKSSSQFILDFYQENLKSLIGNPTLSLQSTLAENLPSSDKALTKRTQKEKKSQKKAFKYYTTQIEIQEHLQQRRMIEEKIKDPVSREFCLQYNHIISMDFTNRRKERSPEQAKQEIPIMKKVKWENNE